MNGRTVALAGLAALIIAGAVLVRPAAVLEFLGELVWSPWFPLVLVGLYAVRPIVGWPISVCSALVGIRYGVWIGLPIALVGAVATSLLPYALGRRYGPDAGGLLGRLVSTSIGYFGAVGDLRGVIAARLAPTHPEPVSAAAGAARVSLPAFAIGTVVGELPWTIAALLAGTSLAAWRTAAVDPSPWLLAGGVIGATVLIAGPTYRWIRTERRPAAG